MSNIYYTALYVQEDSLGMVGEPNLRVIIDSHKIFVEVTSKDKHGQINLTLEQAKEFAIELLAKIYRVENEFDVISPDR